MNIKARRIFTALSAVAILFDLLLSGCAVHPELAPTAPLRPTNAPGMALTPTPAPRLPTLTLNPGDSYFSLDGQLAFIFSRNIAGYQISQYKQFLDLTKTGGSRVARIQLDSMGMGYTSTGEVDENWVISWNQVFERAEEDGIYILPVFSGWFDWNAGSGYSTWKSNPLNQANGGPVKTPDELFQAGSVTQNMWLDWVKSLVIRWQGRKNILAWEIFSEVNLASGATEPAGIALVDRAAAIIRAADPSRRPVTASLADTGGWPNFYRRASIDFINLHPYPPSAQLDRVILLEVRQELATYDRPVLIGESGLNADTPDNYPPNAATGVRHAIWAGLVSGAMNGRALYWEDSFAIYFPNLGLPWIQKYADAELPAANFVEGVDFSGFKPLPAQFGGDVFGAAIGNEKMAIGWFRDALSEPPDWNLRAVISSQSVTITLPGTSADWKVDFYDTKTGTDITASATVRQEGGAVTVILPDFRDDIAFKMTRQASSTSVAVGPSGTPASASTDSIAGKWTGTISADSGSFSTLLNLSILSGCMADSVCGTVSTPQLSCSGDLLLTAIDGNVFTFSELNMTGASGCVSGGQETLHLQADGNLSFRYVLNSSQGAAISSGGILHRP